MFLNFLLLLAGHDWIFSTVRCSAPWTTQISNIQYPWSYSVQWTLSTTATTATTDYISWRFSNITIEQVDTTSLSLPMRHFHPEEGEIAGKVPAEWDNDGSSKGITTKEDKQMTIIATIAEADVKTFILR